MSAQAGPVGGARCRLAVMQPYLFPYVGYFQLVSRVDRFVFLDDVNFINRGWINRNQMLLSDSVKWFTIPVLGSSQNRRINELHVQADGTWRRKLLSSVRHSYGKAPCFEQAYALLEDIILAGETSLSTIARKSVVSVARYLGLETEFIPSTGRYGNEDLRGAARVLDICRQEGAAEYYNLPGGTALYSGEVFSAAGLELHFIEPKLLEYKQFEQPFKPGLSILDVLMFNDRLSTLRLLGCETSR